jgi:hypothetical protein
MEPFGDWTMELRADLERNDRNADVGTALVLDDDRATVVCREGADEPLPPAVGAPR